MKKRRLYFFLMVGIQILSAETSALLIGNASYPLGTQQLPEIRSELPQVTRSLRRFLKFEEIEMQYNLDTVPMNRSLETFIKGAEKSPGIEGKDFCYLHFSGHGLIEGSQILLLPSDSKYHRDSGNMQLETIPLTRIFAMLEEHDEVPVIVILDCCLEGQKDEFKLSYLEKRCPDNVCLVTPVSIGEEAPAKSLLNQELLRCLADDNLKTWDAVVENLANPKVGFSPLVINSRAVSKVDKEEQVALNRSDGNSLTKVLKELETRQSSAGQKTRNSVGHQLIFCPPGRCQMGSKPGEMGHSPKDEMVIDRMIPTPFLIGRREVTQGDWKIIFRTNLAEQAEKAFQDDVIYDSMNGRTIRDFFSAKKPTDLVLKEEDELPICWVNSLEAREYCAELTRLEQARGFLPAGWEYGLPTEWEWEYACRGGDFKSFNFETDLSEAGWSGKNSFIEYEGRGLARSTLFPTAPEINEAGPRVVGLKSPNPWGLYDCLGNVWEICEREEGDHLTPRRGGSWLTNAESCRPANRDQIK
ncbi:MAG: sulfatase activating formylglycine-generating enzyme, partial [Akkermansiaceae bacterium]